MSQTAADPNHPIIVSVVEDEASCRNSLALLLTAAGFEVREFSSARQFLDSPDCEIVSCVVSDLQMPGMNGLQLQAILREEKPYLSIVFLTGYGEVPETVTAMKAGAVDFLEKPVESAVLMQAIYRATERSQELKANAIERSELRLKYQSLTKRERDVMSLVTAGLLNKQVAAELGLAEKTVKQHRAIVMKKMNAESIADLAVMAERLGVRPTTDLSRAKGRAPSSTPM
jgi:FixJ family two-component response regulator